MTSIEILGEALSAISKYSIKVDSVSTWWVSKPFPIRYGPNYVNGVIEASSKLMPKEMMSSLKEIEKLAGRKSSGRWRDRILDLDLLSCGDMVLPTEDIFKKWVSLPLSLQKKMEPKQLILPHPRIQDRLFVLVPLSEVAPNWVHPFFRKKPQELIAAANWLEEDLLRPL